MVEWLRGHAVKLVDAAVIGHWLDARPAGPWWALLRDAIDAYTLETGGAELPTEHLLDWLAEWGREIRRSQTALLLLTAHRAKGLEFDHVAILDGAWDKVGKDEDRDAPRRLFYVAMTRARSSLTIAGFERGHAFLHDLPAGPDILHRPPVQLPRPAPELARRYFRLGLGDVDLGFAGRVAAESALHRAIAALAAGDPLRLRQRNGSFELADHNVVVVGRLARAFRPPAGMCCIAARVAAIIVRLREDGEPEYQGLIRGERWEVVVPDLIYAPVH